MKPSSPKSGARFDRCEGVCWEEQAMTSAAFKYLDEAAIEKLEMRTSPYEWGYIDNAIPSKFKEEILASFKKRVGSGVRL